MTRRSIFAYSARAIAGGGDAARDGSAAGAAAGRVCRPSGDGCDRRGVPLRVGSAFRPDGRRGTGARLAGGTRLAWAAILDRAPAAPLGRYGEDPGWALVRSALDAMQATLPHPAFVVLPGDFLAHSFRRQVRRDRARPLRCRLSCFRRQDVRLPRRRTAPPLPRCRRSSRHSATTTASAATTGCGPTARSSPPRCRSSMRSREPDPAPTSTPSGRGSASTICRCRGSRTSESSSSTPSISPPSTRMPALRPVPTDPAPAVLHWLAARLAQARAAGDHVWLLMHIPPGIDVYATLHGDAAPKVETMWREDDAAAFASLARQYAPTITMSFAGHTHMDEFRLIDGAGPVLVTPAISPIFGQNPGFRDVALWPGRHDPRSHDDCARQPASRRLAARIRFRRDMGHAAPRRRQPARARRTDSAPTSKLPPAISRCTRSPAPRSGSRASPRSRPRSCARISAPRRIPMSRRSGRALARSNEAHALSAPGAERAGQR